ncbi:MAG TPA: helix-turn-helix domain-containing protein [Candidatus Dormibacteraeota bacterium]|nr:helix-turn-helix domain-containing protein [Candidatus Dormibacteraeota bacterium]
MGRQRGASVAESASPKPERRRLPGVNLRSGAVKQARQEAGLSLAQVGKGHVTAPAIFLIETGRTRPSLPTLEHIARRTNKPVEYFLADPGGVSNEAQDGLVELESLLAHGRYTEAIELGQKLLSLGSSAYRLGPIRYHIARAYLQLGKPEPAGDLLRQACTHFESIGDTLMLAECLGSQASLAYMTQQPNAVAIAQRALALCRSLNPTPETTEARLLGVLATAQLAAYEFETAMETYKEAIEVAGSLHDLRRLALMYHGLCIAYRETGQNEAATRYANRSVALLEVLRDRVSLARIENDLGLLMMAKGDNAGARKHMDRAVGLAVETELEVGRSGLILSLAELSLQEGNVDAAAELAEEGLKLAERMEEGVNIAEAHMWLGRVAEQRGQDATVDHEFEVAFQGLTKHGGGERLLRCHGMYAEILERRGDMQRAYVHMKKALSASRPGLLNEKGLPSAERAGSG